MNHKAIFSCVLALALSACAGLPDKLPPPHMNDLVPLAGLPMESQTGWPDPEWWRHYEDPQLNRLMTQALADSSSLAVARQRVIQAEQAARVTAVSNGVKINGSAQVARQRLSEHGLIPAQFLGFTWYNQADLGVQLSYSFDWWGKHRARVEAALGQARAARASESAAAIALQSAVAQTYFAWQVDQARLAVVDQSVQAQKRLVRIASVRSRAGVESADPVLQAKAALAAIGQQRTQLQGMAAIHHASLAALVGISPDALGKLEVQLLPVADAQLPANAGIDLIARRADIAASRWQIEAALRKTDVARTEFLPDLSLSAMAGLSSIDLGKLLDPSSRTFAFGPALHLPIFQAGLLKAHYGLSRAELDVAVANYNDSIMQAAREVATQALTVQQLANLREGQQQQLTLLQGLLDKSQSRHQRGLTSLAPVLQARLAVLQQDDAALVLEARALSADVELIHALGGGYHITPPTHHSHSTNTPGPAHD